jgi:hypothetical protein
MGSGASSAGGRDGLGGLPATRTRRDVRIARDVQRRFVLTSQRVAPERETPWLRRAQDGA